MKYGIIAAIVLYCIWILYRTIKNIKKGKTCGCGCEDCPAKCREYPSENSSK